MQAQKKYASENILKVGITNTKDPIDFVTFLMKFYFKSKSLKRRHIKNFQQKKSLFAHKNLIYRKCFYTSLSGYKRL